jgi:hypothetical protein
MGYTVEVLPEEHHDSVFADLPERVAAAGVRALRRPAGREDFVARVAAADERAAGWADVIEVIATPRA